MAFDLNTFERWMLTAISHRDGLEGGLPVASALLPVTWDTLEDVIEPSKSLCGHERLAIYADMYFWRLVGILADDFEAVRHALGEDAFDALARDYLDTYPSGHYRLAGLGSRLPRFIAETARKVPHRAFLAQLASLESTLETLFDAAQADPLTPAEVQAVPPERWAGARLTPIPAFALHAFDWPVNEYFQSVMEASEPPIPRRRRPTWIAAYRKDYRIYRLRLTREQHTILTAIAAGATLGEAIEAAASLPGVNVEALVGELGAWFQEWTAEGFFSGVTLASE